MKDISNIRIMRWVFACLIVFPLWALVAGSGIAAAETGTINVESVNNYFYVPSTGSTTSGSETNFSVFLFDVTDYFTLTEYRVTFSAAIIASPLSNSSEFTIDTNTGNSGHGYFYYDGSTKNMTWVFSSDTHIVSSPVYVTYTYPQIFNAFTTIVASSTKNAPDASTLSPIYLANTQLQQLNSDKYVGVISYHNALFVGTNTHINYNVTYPLSGFYNVNIDKIPGTIGTRVFIHSQTVAQFSEPLPFNTVDFNSFNNTLDGIYINVTMAAGGFIDVLINASGANIPVPPVPLVVDPVTGVGIKFDQSDYALGDVANISWLRTSPTPFGDTDYIVSTNPYDQELEIVSSPADSGYTKILMSPAGTWDVEFRRSSLLFGVSVLASANATVGADQPSYIIAPAQVPIGQLFNVTYLIGWTVSQGSNAWIRTYHWDDALSQWENTYQSFAASGVKGTEISSDQILVTKQGKYLIKLCDVLSGCKASTQTEAFFNGSEITTNITLSNISIDKTTYSYGETMMVTASVDNFNWSNKQIVVEYYNYGGDITTNQIYVQTQTLNVPLYVSDLTFIGSGVSALRLVGKNDTGNYILAFVNFTLSNVDAEGYGLDITGNTSCIGNTVQIKAIVPAGDNANLTISADNVKWNKDIVVNGSRTIPYTFRESGTYYMTLSLNGVAKRLRVVNVGSCVVPTPTVTPPDQQKAMADMSVLLTSSFFWAILLTVGLMVMVAIELKNTPPIIPMVVTGFLSISGFTLIGWIPAWITFSIILLLIVIFAWQRAKDMNTAGE